MHLIHYWLLISVIFICFIVTGCTCDRYFLKIDTASWAITSKTVWYLKLWFVFNRYWYCPVSRTGSSCLEVPVCPIPDEVTFTCSCFFNSGMSCFPGSSRRAEKNPLKVQHVQIYCSCSRPHRQQMEEMIQCQACTQRLRGETFCV